jgi:epoxyqueuosine reductase
VEPGVLDARLCISTWTLEQKENVDPKHWDAHTGWAAGCDICQTVCPYNNPERMKEPDAELADPLPWARLSLAEAITLTEEQFDQNFPASALRRTGWKGIRLGAITAAATFEGARDFEIIGPLLVALEDAMKDPDPDIKARATWAAERITLARGV